MAIDRVTILHLQKLKLGFISQHRHEGRVDHEELAVRIRAIDTVGRPLDDGLVLRFGTTEGFFRLPLFGDVKKSEDRSDDNLIPNYRVGPILDGKAGSVGSPKDIIVRMGRLSA